MLNEVFGGQKRLDPNKVDLARNNARLVGEALKRYGYRVAVVGGSSRDWNVDPAFDEIAQECRQIIAQIALCPVYSGAGVFFELQKRDPWHFAAVPSTMVLMADYLWTLIKAVTITTCDYISIVRLRSARSWLYLNNPCHLQAIRAVELGWQS